MIVECTSCKRSNRLPAARLGENAKCAACKAALLPLKAPVQVGTPEDFDELVREAKSPVLVDFWADWCGPCHAVAPELAKLANDRAGKIIVAKVNTEVLQGIAARFGIRSIPTMVLMKDGKEAKRVSGAMPAQMIAEQLAL